MNWLEILLIGIFTMAGIGWQGLAFTKMSQGQPPLVVIVPASIGFILLVGLIVHGIIYAFVGTGDYTFSEFLSLFWAILFTTIVLTIKGVFSPLLLALTIIMIIYSLFEPGDFKFWSFEIVQDFMDWLIGSFPKWIKNTYTVIMYLVIIGGSITSAIEEA